jgi:hypothetical protein
MNGDSELVALVDLIYEAVLDSDLWPSVLVKLASATGAAQVSMTSRDLQAGIFTTLSPRTDPDLVALQGILEEPSSALGANHLLACRQNLHARRSHAATGFFGHFRF